MMEDTIERSIIFDSPYWFAVEIREEGQEVLHMFFTANGNLISYMRGLSEEQLQAGRAALDALFAVADNECVTLVQCVATFDGALESLWLRRRVAEAIWAVGIVVADEAYLGESTLAKLRNANLFGANDEDDE